MHIAPSQLQYSSATPNRFATAKCWQNIYFHMVFAVNEHTCSEQQHRVLYPRLKSHELIARIVNTCYT